MIIWPKYVKLFIEIWHLTVLNNVLFFDFQYSWQPLFPFLDLLTPHFSKTLYLNRFILSGKSPLSQAQFTFTFPLLHQFQYQTLWHLFDLSVYMVFYYRIQALFGIECAQTKHIAVDDRLAFNPVPVLDAFEDAFDNGLF